MEMRRNVMKTILGALGVGLVLSLSAAADAQEIQLTGPLAGAPAVRKLRLHREGRFEVAAGASFTLLDEYRRTIIPGLKLTYHPTDWFGLGAWGGIGLGYNTGLADELQEKAIDNRRCDINPASRACALTAVNLTRPGAGTGVSGVEPATGQLADDQLGQMQWIAAPQLTFVPFRGKLALFSALFLDTDVNIFLGAAFIGIQERAECGTEAGVPCSDSFMLESRLAVAPTFGLGLNFYPADFLSFGVEWRGLPFSWSTGGFDVAGEESDFPDNNFDSNDREFHFNSVLTVNVAIQLPTTIEVSE